MESLKWIIQRRADQVAAKAHGSLNRVFGQVSSSKALSDGHADPNEDDRKLFTLANDEARYILPYPEGYPGYLTTSESCSDLSMLCSFSKKDCLSLVSDIAQHAYFW